MGEWIVPVALDGRLYHVIGGNGYGLDVKCVKPKNAPMTSEERKCVLTKYHRRGIEGDVFGGGG